MSGKLEEHFRQKSKENKSFEKQLNNVFRNEKKFHVQITFFPLKLSDKYQDMQVYTLARVLNMIPHCVLQNDTSREVSLPPLKDPPHTAIQKFLKYFIY